jgi:heparinase II/III-like protein
VQVLPDGADFESSVPYHRLVTELFLASARLADYTGAPLPPGVRCRLRNMIDVLTAVQRPDGLMPQVGDADDGRLHILSGYGMWQPQDGRHLFGPAASFLGNRDWISQGGEWMPWETTWWGFDTPDVPFAGAARRDGLKHFPQAGLTVMRRGRDYLLVTNGMVGTAGFGNHKHNDLLGFEYHVDGRPVFVDPGSYVYTPDPDARNRFRGTLSHNTLGLDGVEQNDLVPEYLFRLFEKGVPEHLEVEEQSDSLRYRGRHHGYTRLPQPVVHERTFTLSRLDSVLTIADVLHGQGAHRMCWHFHFAPGVEVSAAPSGSIDIHAGATLLAMTGPAGLRPTLGRAWYSPSYGVRLPCACLDFETEDRVDGRREYMFRITS